MRHRKSGVKLNRTSSHRKAMFRNMVTSLFKHESIKTTDAKAKELRKWADSMITLAKRGDLHARRQALAVIREKDVVHKLFEEASERFGSVGGGYTRITKLGTRPGDAASISLIELVTPKASKPKKKKETKKQEKVETVVEETPVETVAEDAPVEDTPVEAAAEEKPADSETESEETTEEVKEETDEKKE